MVEKIKKTSQNQAGSGARKGALELLHQLFRHPEDATPLPVMLSRCASARMLDSRDTALLSELVYGVLRRHAVLDAALAARPRKIVIKRPPKGPWLAGVKPSHSLAGKAVRYDVIVPPRG